MTECYTLFIHSFSIECVECEKTRETAKTKWSSFVTMDVLTILYFNADQFNHWCIWMSENHEMRWIAIHKWSERMKKPAVALQCDSYFEAEKINWSVSEKKKNRNLNRMQCIVMSGKPIICISIFPTFIKRSTSKLCVFCCFFYFHSMQPCVFVWSIHKRYANANIDGRLWQFTMTSPEL